MKLRILFHDSCFDGTASASLFARFARARLHPEAEIEYLGVQHKAGDPFPPDAFSGDENACVDFRYSPSPRLTWWFDHHASAFPTPADRAAFEADRSGRKYYDPRAKSCTRFMARVLADEHGFDVAAARELIDWAEIIDGALFPDARMAVALEEPALRLMTWIEHNRDRALTTRYIEDLQRRSLAEIAVDEYVAGPLAPVLARHREVIDLIRRKAVCADRVVTFDLVDDGVEAYNKFIAYMLHPEADYSVSVTRGPARVKISVGFNPWSPRPRQHDIARLCEAHGGGGHPVVGAISLPPTDAERGRAIAAGIVATLRGAA